MNEIDKFLKECQGKVQNKNKLAYLDEVGVESTWSNRPAKSADLSIETVEKALGEMKMLMQIDKISGFGNEYLLFRKLWGLDEEDKI